MPLTVLSYHHHRRVISNLLVPALVLMLLFPVHYHLQHHDDQHGGVVASHAHNLTIGHIADIHPLNHHFAVAHHSDSHVIDSGTELSKPSALKLPPFIIALVLALLLPAIDRSCRYRLMRAIALSIPSFRHKHPLLRAPPGVC